MGRGTLPVLVWVAFSAGVTRGFRGVVPARRAGVLSVARHVHSSSGAHRSAAPALARRLRRLTATEMGASLEPAAASASANAASEDVKAKKKKVLLLLSDTGGGHRASAEAIENALERLYGDRVECELVDVWTDHTKAPFNKFVPWYAFVGKRPWMWRLLWMYTSFPVTRELQKRWAMWACLGSFKSCIATSAPDLVVSVHPLCQDIPLRALEMLGNGTRAVPFATVVTDLATAHSTWFHPKVDKCFVPSESLQIQARRWGVAESKIALHGLPLRASFWDPETRSPKEVREALGFASGDSGALTALLVGGGDGVGGIQKIARRIARELGELKESRFNLAVICGKNEAAKLELEQERFPENVHVHVEGFVRNMDEWMAAADCIVTKAGPGTIAEACTRGLATLCSSALPGQEVGNLRFVRENKFGYAFWNPVCKLRRIAKTVAKLFADQDMRDDFRRNAYVAARPNATLDIAKGLGDLLFA